MDRADIGVVESRGRLRLPLEAGQGLGVFGDVVGQKLQGYKPMEVYVLCLVDDTHPAATQPLHNAVVRNGLADHWAEILGLEPGQVNEVGRVGWSSRG